MRNICVRKLMGDNPFAEDFLLWSYYLIFRTTEYAHQNHIKSYDARHEQEWLYNHG